MRGQMLARQVPASLHAFRTTLRYAVSDTSSNNGGDDERGTS